MAKFIAFIAQKGGAGKSSTSRTLAVYLAGLGHKVVLADLDHNQLTTADWGKARKLNNREPEIDVQLVNVEKDGLYIKGQDEADYVILDCPGRADATIAAAAEAADLVVLPTQPGADSLRPLIRLARELKRIGLDLRRCMITLFRVHSDTEIAAARTYIASVDDLDLRVSAGAAPNSGDASTIFTVGRSLLDLRGTQQKQQVSDMMESLASAADQPPSAKPADDQIDWSAMDWDVLAP